MVLDRPEIPLHTNGSEKTSAAKSPSERSAAAQGATPVATAVMPSSASARLAQNSASPSGITSAHAWQCQTSPRSHTCQQSSGIVAPPPDCPDFCPSYQDRARYQQTRQQRHGLQRTRQRGPQPRLPQRQWLRRGPCPQLPQRQCCTWTTGFASAAPSRMAPPLAGAADAPVTPPSAIPAAIAIPKKIPRIVFSTLFTS